MEFNMCLNTVELALYWNETEQAYVGTGYKSYVQLSCNWNYINFKIGKWFNFNPKNWKYNDKLSYHEINKYERYCEEGDDSKKYVPGFHIFLKAIDAKNYGNAYVYEVMYKNVLGFGTNHTNGTIAGQCVIAADMKIVRKLNKRSIKGK